MIGSCCAAQARLELLISSNPPILASQSAGLMVVSHCVYSKAMFLKLGSLKTLLLSPPQAGWLALYKLECLDLGPPLIFPFGLKF